MVKQAREVQLEGLPEFGVSASQLSPGGLDLSIRISPQTKRKATPLQIAKLKKRVLQKLDFSKMGFLDFILWTLVRPQQNNDLQETGEGVWRVFLKEHVPFRSNEREPKKELIIEQARPNGGWQLG